MHTGLDTEIPYVSPDNAAAALKVSVASAGPTVAAIKDITVTVADMKAVGDKYLYTRNVEITDADSPHSVLTVQASVSLPRVSHMFGASLPHACLGDSIRSERDT